MPFGIPEYPGIISRFPFVHSYRPKRIGFGQFKWKSPRSARTFSRHKSPDSHAFTDGAGELIASDPWTGPFWPEPALRTCAFHLRTDSGRTGMTRQMANSLIIIRALLELPVNQKHQLSVGSVRQAKCLVHIFYKCGGLQLTLRWLVLLK